MDIYLVGYGRGREKGRRAERERERLRQRQKLSLQEGDEKKRLRLQAGRKICLHEQTEDGVGLSLKGTEQIITFPFLFYNKKTGG